MFILQKCKMYINIYNFTYIFNIVYKSISKCTNVQCNYQLFLTNINKEKLKQNETLNNVCLKL